MLSRLTALAIVTTLLLASCQGQDSFSPSGPGKLNPAVAPSPEDPQTIRDALAECVNDPQGLGNSAAVHFDNIVRKKTAGDIQDAAKRGGELITLLYERNSEGRWICSDSELAATIWAIATYVGIPVPDVEDIEDTLGDGGGGICFAGQGCRFLTADGCTGIDIPAQGNDNILFVSVTPVEPDPFLGVFPIYNSWPLWGAIHVEGLIGELDPAATVATLLVDPPDPAAPIAAVAARARLGHIFFNETTLREEVEILPLPDQSILSCNPSTAQTGWVGRLASLFSPTSLIANPGELGGKLSSFSEIGAVDPASDTKVGIAPSNTSLNDQQSATLTATVQSVASPVTGTLNPIPAGDSLEFLVDGVVWSQAVTNASGQASLTLKCGVDIGAGSHTVDAHYLRTDTHAESSTADDDSPTGSATVSCLTTFTPINFDRGPDGNPLKNGEIVNTIYQSLGVTFSRNRTASQNQCGTQNAVYAVSDPATGHFASPPRVVSLCASGDSRISAGTNAHGWIRADFTVAKSQVCIAVFPATGGHKGEIRAFNASGVQIGSNSGQGTDLCVSATGIRRVEFSGAPSGSRLAKFDNLRFR
jgi:hypothetical protein